MGNRYYPIEVGTDKVIRELASVTTITGLADKSDALIPWAVGLAVDYIDNNLGKAWPSFERLSNMIKLARTEWRTVRDEAGDIGTEVHDALENWLRFGMEYGLTEAQPEDFAPEDSLAQKLFYAAVNKIMALGSNIKVLAVEQRVVNEDEWYAGRFDALLEVDGEIWLIDFKTGGAFYPEWGMQLAAYAEAWQLYENWLAYDDIRDAYEIDHIKILRLDKKTLKAHWKDYTEQREWLYRAFLGLRDAFYILKAKKSAREAFLNARP